MSVAGYTLVRFSREGEAEFAEGQIDGQAAARRERIGSRPGEGLASERLFAEGA